MKKTTFDLLFDGGGKLTIDTCELVELFGNAWKYGIKEAGKYKQMLYSEYDENDGCEHIYFKEREIEVGNIKFRNLGYDYNIDILVKIDDTWMEIYSRSGYRDKGWLYPLETKAIREVLRFLKDLANKVDIARNEEAEQKRKEEKEAQNREAEAYARRKNKLDKFEFRID